MPDSTKKTVSASQVPAIFNMSPYNTRWMLHQHFLGNIDLDIEPDDRMNWGTRLEPVIIKAAAEELRCDILPHDQSTYLRAPDAPVGCTPDGYVLDPQRGPGFIECKNVDWFRWKDTWDDKAAPHHIELQLQTQLMVPHPEYGKLTWGCIACLVGGNDLLLYDRQPLPEVHAGIKEQAEIFLADVEARREPEVLGVSIELPSLKAVYAVRDKVKVLTEQDFDLAEGVRIARMIDAYELAKDRESFSKKEAAELQAKLLAAAGDAAGLILYGRFLNISTSQIAGRTQTVKPYTMTRVTASLQAFPADLDAILPKREPAGEYDLPKDIFV